VKWLPEPLIIRATLGLFLDLSVKWLPETAFFHDLPGGSRIEGHVSIYGNGALFHDLLTVACGLALDHPEPLLRHQEIKRSRDQRRDDGNTSCRQGFWDRPSPIAAIVAIVVPRMVYINRPLLCTYDIYREHVTNR
jgi:hypothetical protein